MRFVPQQAGRVGEGEGQRPRLLVIRTRQWFCGKVYFKGVTIKSLRGEGIITALVEFAKVENLFSPSPPCP
jgi:hypothetical protein